MGVSTVVIALAGLAVFLAAVVIGVLMVLGGRGDNRQVSERVRRYFNDRRRQDRGF